MTPKEFFELGYEAAANGESRTWAEQFGLDCVKGYDAYWEEYGP